MADSMKTKDFGRYEALPGGEEGAGEAAEHGADRKGRELGVGGVDAERPAGDLILAQGLPGAADRQPPQPDGHQIGDERQNEDHVIEEDDALDRLEFGLPVERQERVEPGGEALEQPMKPLASSSMNG